MGDPILSPVDFVKSLANANGIEESQAELYLKKYQGNHTMASEAMLEANGKGAPRDWIRDVHAQKGLPYLDSETLNLSYLGPEEKSSLEEERKTLFNDVSTGAGIEESPFGPVTKPFTPEELVQKQSRMKEIRDRLQKSDEVSKYMPDFFKIEPTAADGLSDGAARDRVAELRKQAELDRKGATDNFGLSSGESAGGNWREINDAKANEKIKQADAIEAIREKEMSEDPWVLTGRAAMMNAKVSGGDQNDHYIIANKYLKDHLTKLERMRNQQAMQNATNPTPEGQQRLEEIEYYQDQQYREYAKTFGLEQAINKKRQEKRIEADKKDAEGSGIGNYARAFGKSFMHSYDSFMIGLDQKAREIFGDKETHEEFLAHRKAYEFRLAEHTQGAEHSGDPILKSVEVGGKKYQVSDGDDIDYAIDDRGRPLEFTAEDQKNVDEYNANRDRYKVNRELSGKKLAGTSTDVLLNMLPIIATNVAATVATGALPGGQAKAARTLASVATSFVSMYYNNLQQAMELGKGYQYAKNTANGKTLVQSLIEQAGGLEARTGKKIGERLRKALREAGDSKNYASAKVFKETLTKRVGQAIKSYGSEASEELAQDFTDVVWDNARYGLENRMDWEKELNMLLTLPFGTAPVGAAVNAYTNYADRREFRRDMVKAAADLDAAKKALDLSVEAGVIDQGEADIKYAALERSHKKIAEVQGDNLENKHKIELLNIIADQERFNIIADGAASNSIRDEYRAKAEKLGEKFDIKHKAYRDAAQEAGVENPDPVVDSDETPFGDKPLNDDDFTTGESKVPGDETAGTNESDPGESKGPEVKETPPEATPGAGPTESTTTVPLDVDPETEKKYEEFIDDKVAPDPIKKPEQFIGQNVFLTIGGKQRNVIPQKAGSRFVIVKNEKGKTEHINRREWDKATTYGESKGNVNEDKTASANSASEKPVAAPVSKIAKAVEEIEVGDQINYQGIQGELVDKKGVLYVRNSKGKEIVIEGGTNPDLTWRDRGVKLVNKKRKAPEGVSANTVTTDFSKNKVTINGKEHEYVRSNKDNKGSVVSVTLRDKKGKLKTFRDVADVQQIIAQKIAYEDEFQGRNAKQEPAIQASERKSEALEAKGAAFVVKVEAVESQGEAAKEQEVNEYEAAIDEVIQEVEEEINAVNAILEMYPGSTIEEIEKGKEKADKEAIKKGIVEEKRDAKNNEKLQKNAARIAAKEARELAKKEKKAGTWLARKKRILREVTHPASVEDYILLWFLQSKTGLRISIESIDAVGVITKYLRIGPGEMSPKKTHEYKQFTQIGGLMRLIDNYTGPRPLGMRQSTSITNIIADSEFTDLFGEENQKEAAEEIVETLIKLTQLPSPKKSVIEILEERYFKEQQVPDDWVEDSDLKFQAESNEVKAAERALSKAQSALAKAEAEFGEAKNVQQSMFADQGAQARLFGDSRDTIKSILDPLRQKVAEAKEALEKARNKAKVAEDKSGGQQSLFQKAVKRFTPVTTQRFNALLENLNNAIGNVFGGLLSETEIRKHLQDMPGGREFISKGGKLYGFISGGKVYLSKGAINANTPIHEYGHIWVAIMKKVRPDILKRGYELVAKSKYLEKILNNPGYAKERQAYISGDQDGILEEALVTAIGDQGEQIVNRALKKQFKTWIQDFWNAVKGVFGGSITQLSPEKLQNISLDAFTTLVAGQLAAGIEVKEQNPFYDPNPGAIFNNILGNFGKRLPKVEIENITFTEVKQAEDGTLLAPNGKPSNLTPEQYRLVRTPEFKNWFGDWESAANVVYHGTEKKRPFTGDVEGDIGIHFGTKKAADERLFNLDINDGNVSPYKLSLKNPIRLRDVGAWADFKPVADELLKKGIITQTEYNTAEKFAKTQKFWEKEHKVLVEILKSKGYDGIVYKNDSEDAGSDSYIVFFTNQIKDATDIVANVSKVVDENGEPLVVYHGSQNSSIQFDNDRTAYFTDNKKTASSFSDRSFMGESLLPGEIPTVYPVFLNIRTPRNLSKESEYESLFQDTGNQENVKKSGNDGMVYKPAEGGDNYYAAFSPNQIKLADGTNTTFDSNTNDIRFQVEVVDDTKVAVDGKIVYHGDSPRDAKAFINRKYPESHYDEQTGAFKTRDGKLIGYHFDTEMVARERFDFSVLKKIGSGSDRDVYDLGDGKVLKVAKTARGLEQNMHEGNYDLNGITPKQYEGGLNYVVVENVPKAKASDVVTTYDWDSGAVIGKDTIGGMINDLSDISQEEFDKHHPNVEKVLGRYGFTYLTSYDMLWGDFIRLANWGYDKATQTPIHIDGGTFGGVRMIRNYIGKKNMSDPDFRKIYQESKKLKKQYGDTDKQTMYQLELDQSKNRVKEAWEQMSLFGVRSSDWDRAANMRMLINAVVDLAIKQGAKSADDLKNIFKSFIIDKKDSLKLRKLRDEALASAGKVLKAYESAPNDDPSITAMLAEEKDSIEGAIMRLQNILDSMDVAANPVRAARIKKYIDHLDLRRRADAAQTEVVIDIGKIRTKEDFQAAFNSEMALYNTVFGRFGVYDPTGIYEDRVPMAGKPDWKIDPVAAILHANKVLQKWHGVYRAKGLGKDIRFVEMITAAIRKDPENLAMHTIGRAALDFVDHLKAIGEPNTTKTYYENLKTMVSAVMSGELGHRVSAAMIMRKHDNKVFWELARTESEKIEKVKTDVAVQKLSDADKDVAAHDELLEFADSFKDAKKEMRKAQRPNEKHKGSAKKANIDVSAMNSKSSVVKDLLKDCK